MSHHIQWQLQRIQTDIPENPSVRYTLLRALAVTIKPGRRSASIHDTRNTLWWSQNSYTKLCKT